MAMPDADQMNWDTPLMVACQASDLPVVHALLQSGVSVNAMRMGRAALHDACRHGRDDVVRLLTQAGANVLLRDGHGVCAMEEACRVGHAMCVYALLRAGYPPDGPCSDGWSPLKIACYFGNVLCVHVLLSEGAQPARRSPEGKTVLEDLEDLERFMAASGRAPGRSFRHHVCIRLMRAAMLDPVAKTLVAQRPPHRTAARFRMQDDSTDEDAHIQQPPGVPVIEGCPSTSQAHSSQDVRGVGPEEVLRRSLQGMRRVACARPEAAVELPQVQRLASANMPATPARRERPQRAAAVEARQRWCEGEESGAEESFGTQVGSDHQADLPELGCHPSGPDRAQPYTLDELLMIDLTSATRSPEPDSETDAENQSEYAPARRIIWRAYMS